MQVGRLRFLIAWALVISCSSGFAQDDCSRVSNSGQLKVKYKKKGRVSDACACPNLTSLKLNQWKFPEIPDCALNNESLKEISFYACSMRMVPESLKGAVFIETLDFTGSEIFELPNWIGDLPALKSLILTRTNVYDLPEYMGQIEMVDMRHTGISKEKQDELEERYPYITFYFNAPCNCE